MRMVSFASGSSGNCILIGSESTHILIDAGISCKRINEGLHQIGLKQEDLSAILITHEHSDHVRGLSILMKRSPVPLYATPQTIAALAGLSGMADCAGGFFHEVNPDVTTQVGDLSILPFSVSHDAANPVGYRISDGKKQVAVATDMGIYDQYTVDHLMGLNAVLLESNHDVNMLLTGRYPYYLKQRILSEKGHLSNENAGRLLDLILNDRMQAVFLGHLSRENNYEALAYETVRLEINQGDSVYRADDFPIYIAHRDRFSEMINL